MCGERVKTWWCRCGRVQSSGEDEHELGNAMCIKNKVYLLIINEVEL